jgi:hypothetical protein
MATRRTGAAKATAKIGRKKAAPGRSAVKKSAAGGGRARTAKAATAAPTRARVSVDPAATLRIRMYCQGLGDCFLLTLPPSGTRKSPVRVLIDFGVLQGTPNAGEKLKSVAGNIVAETGGEIDLLIVTHEHWDHVAGFSLARSVLKDLKIKRVWLSWAENPDDRDAIALKESMGRKRKKLAAALAGIDALRFQGLNLEGDVGLAVGVASSMMAFEGLAVDESADADDKAPKLGEVMDALRERVRAGDFLSPGERRDVPGTNLTAWVLGPPRDKAAIRKEDPTGDEGFHLAGLDGEGFLSSPGPFRADRRISPEEARTMPFFRRNYGFDDDPLAPPDAAWRRIDHDWLASSVSTLALQLDDGVNNTSLALAFELPDGRTLIFPGDAQIGNWKSWSGVFFRNSNGSEVTSSEKLLGEAVVYKVGHHGSHNATLKAGLMAMTRDDLVAFIPTDEEQGLAKRPNPWRMPAQALNEQLIESTRGRILRADRDRKAVEKSAGTHAGGTSWKRFMKRVTFAETLIPRDPKREKGREDQPLWVEYELEVGG